MIDPDATETISADRVDEASWGYRPGLDGLRAVAVVAVVLYHDGIRWLPGGFLGVDVFFALSGFLITSLLLDEYDRHGRIRLHRVLGPPVPPAAPAVLLLLVGHRPVLQFFVESLLVVPTRRRGDAPWVLDVPDQLALHHVERRRTSRRSPRRTRSGTCGRWPSRSSCYLLWPPVLIVGALAPSRVGPTCLLATAAVLAVVSAVLMAVLIPALGDPTRSYYGTDTRAQTVLVGAVAAILLRGPGR